MFGGVDERLHVGSVSYVPVHSKFYWEIAMHAVVVGDRDMHLCGGAAEQCRVAIDTGTSLITGPSASVRKLHAALGVDPGCRNLDRLPTLTFVLGNGTKLVLAANEYVVRVHNARTNKDSCVLGIMPLDVPPPRGPLFAFGALVLRSYLTVFDRSIPQVGFARSLPCDPPCTGPVTIESHGQSVRRPMRRRTVVPVGGGGIRGLTNRQRSLVASLQRDAG